MVDKPRTPTVPVGDIEKLIAQSGKSPAAIAREIGRYGGKASPQTIGTNWLKHGQISSKNLMALQALAAANGAASAAKVSAPAEVLPAELQESRDKNDILAIRFALGGFARVLRSKQPEIAEEAARDMVGAAGVDFASQGFLNVLASLLLGAERMTAAELHAFLRRPASAKRDRAVRQTKR